MPTRRGMAIDAPYRTASGFVHSRQDSSEVMLIKGVPRPDGWGTWSEEGQTVPFFVEWDSGDEVLEVLVRKVAGYDTVAVFTRWRWPVLFVLPSLRRETNLHLELNEWKAAGSTPVATVARDFLAATRHGPAEAVWRLRGHDGPRLRRPVALHRRRSRHLRRHPTRTTTRNEARRTQQRPDCKSQEEARKGAHQMSNAITAAEIIDTNSGGKWHLHPTTHIHHPGTIKHRHRYDRRGPRGVVGPGRQTISEVRVVSVETVSRPPARRRRPSLALAVLLARYWQLHPDHAA